MKKMYKKPIVGTEEVRMESSVLTGSTVVDNSGMSGGSSSENPILVD